MLGCAVPDAQWRSTITCVSCKGNGKDQGEVGGHNHPFGGCLSQPLNSIGFAQYGTIVAARFRLCKRPVTGSLPTTVSTDISLYMRQRNILPGAI